MVKQIGKPIFLPREAARLTPRARERVEVVREPTIREVIRRRGRGGVGVREVAVARIPTISIEGNTITIDGKGFSVRPDLQEQFLKDKGISITSKIKGQIVISKALAEAKAKKVLTPSELRKLTRRQIFERPGVILREIKRLTKTIERAPPKKEKLPIEKVTVPPFLTKVAEEKQVLVQRQIDTFKGVPILATFVVDPKTGKERKATTKESTVFRDLALTVEPGKTKTQILKERIEALTPELKFLGKSSEAETIRKLIGGGFGTEDFIRSKAKGLLSNLRDINGNRIFTDKQASKLTDLVFEVSESLSVGGITGKVFTLGRGAFATTKLAQKLAKAPKFVKKVLKLGEVATVVGLTGLQVKELSKVAKEKGKDAALLRLIGLTSFGVGFAKTGLKSTPEAIREFKKLSDTLKKITPKGKRGQVPLIRKKKKVKGRFAELEQLFVSEGEVEKAGQLISNLENKLVRVKTIKEQLKILAEISKTLKTKRAKDNFKILVQDLADKQIIKLPQFEIVPGVKAIGIPPPKGITIFAPKKKVTPPFKFPEPSVKEKLRIREARTQDEKQTQFSRSPLSERFKSAQKEKQRQSSKVALAQKNIQKQLQKLKTLQKQRAGQKLIQSQLSSLKFAQKQLSSLKVTKITRFKKITPFRIPTPFPIILPPFSKLKKLKPFIKKPSKPIMRSYNVFGKPLKQRKFVKLNRVPLKKSQAKDLGAWLIDHSLGRTFKLKGSPKNTKKPELKIPKNYFQMKKRKFRNFRIVKGEKIKLKNKWIEKKGKPLLDTLAEKKKITLLRQRAILKKKALKKIKMKSSKMIKMKRRKK